MTAKEEILRLLGEALEGAELLEMKGLALLIGSAIRYLNRDIEADE